MSDQQRVARIAVHEAGHTVIAVPADLPIKYVTLRTRAADCAGHRRPRSIFSNEEIEPDPLIREKRTEHSVKPVAAYEMIERMWPDAARLELFARRQNARIGTHEATN